eukprot:CAMPEP_0118990808 /NCGR_PEP_ID=MMETSP1173-20130426/50620_1 /TAXON_ID=1034831 /ORGANISM="Rhizochromulina marina cf, Strain CCMP1243" /LENGTH=47 /DNA_ID= /DNA_START= /DNA_END= /DNA_ORIENTATION=
MGRNAGYTQLTAGRVLEVHVDVESKTCGGGTMMIDDGDVGVARVCRF